MLNYQPVFFMEEYKIGGNGQLSDFFRVVAKGVNKYGIKTIINHLQHLSNGDNDEKMIDDIIDYILDCVIDEWKPIGKISKDDLFEIKKGEASIARKMAIIVIRINTKFSDAQVANYFGKVRQVSFKAMKEFKNLNPKIPDDLRFLQKFEKIDAKVKLFIQELKNKN